MPLRRQIRLRPRAGDGAEPGDVRLSDVRAGLVRVRERHGSERIRRTRTGTYPASFSAAARTRARRSAQIKNFPFHRAHGKTGRATGGRRAGFKILSETSRRAGGRKMHDVSQADLSAVHGAVRLLLLAALPKQRGYAGH